VRPKPAKTSRPSSFLDLEPPPRSQIAIPYELVQDGMEAYRMGYKDGYKAGYREAVMDGRRRAKQPRSSRKGRRGRR